jgi:hypothetical protein
MDESMDALLALDAAGLSYHQCLEHTLALEQAIARLTAHQQVALARLDNDPPPLFKTALL